MSDGRSGSSAPQPADAPAGPGPGEWESLPAWLVDALRRPVAVDPARAARIMALVRRTPGPRRSRPFPLAPHRPRWATRRGVLAPAGGAVLGALLAAFVAAARIGGGRPAAAPAAMSAMSATVLRDTVLGDALRDTMRVVRLVLAAPGAARVGAVVAAGDAALTPLHRDPATGAWTATVVVPRDVVRLAVVVDGRRIAGPRVEGAPRPGAAGLPGDTI